MESASRFWVDGFGVRHAEVDLTPASEGDLIDANAVAAILGVDPGKFRDVLRYRIGFPGPVVIGTRVGENRWSREQVEAWLAKWRADGNAGSPSARPTRS